MERSTVLFRDPSNKGRRFIPLLLADCELPDALRRYKYVDYRVEAATALEELLDVCRVGAEEGKIDVPVKPAQAKPSLLDKLLGKKPKKPAPVPKPAPTEEKPLPLMPKVFISYSQDSDAHKQRVHSLAERLRQAGVSIILDQDFDPGGPDEGWDIWSGNNAEKAAIVLLVFTPTYRRCWDREQPPGMRQGATHETRVLYRRLYEAGAEIDFCRTLTFEADHKTCIPKFIAGLNTFDANRDFSEIVAWLRKLGAVAEDTTGNRPIVWPQPIVDYPWPLADRTDQFELFHQIITARCQERILLVDGPSNSGKSVFVTELFNFAKRLNLRSVLLDLKGCLALDELFATLALEVDRTILPAFHSSSGSARKAALLKDLENLPSPLVLGFDTYQEVPPDIADWIEGQLLRRVGQCPGLVMILSGKAVPERTHFPAWAGLAKPITLPPIQEPQHWHDYAKQQWPNVTIAKEHIEMLLHISKGDPGQTSALLRSFSDARS